MKKITYLLTCSFILFLTACNKSDSGLNIFSLSDDKELGLKVKQEIEADPTQYPILNKSTYQAAYSYLEQMKNHILNSEKVTYKNEFAWELFIIHNDSIQNAFCTPGGYIYIYTGLIKYLDNATSLAGVLGHEIAHADKRHTTEAMTKQYGLSTLVSIVLGNNQSALTDVAQGLIGLSFSRENEKEADKYSVVYLCPTIYRANGASEFFQKIIQQGGLQTPAFLSTHPNPDNRVDNINNEANSLSCNGGNIPQNEDVTAYNAFKATLP